MYIIWIKDMFICFKCKYIMLSKWGKNFNVGFWLFLICLVCKD